MTDHLRSPRMRLLVVLLVAGWLALAAPVSAVIATRVTVATTATLIYTASTGGNSVLVRNAGAASVYLGAAGVATTDGFEVAAGDAVTLPLAQSDTVYGIVAAGTVIVHVLESRR